MESQQIVHQTIIAHFHGRKIDPFPKHSLRLMLLIQEGFLWGTNLGAYHHTEQST